MTGYNVDAIRTMPDGNTIEDNGYLPDIKHLIEALVQDIRMYPTAVQYAYRIIPNKDEQDD